ncbi:hypothetical protein BCR35DRAFT_329907 [Leucosporidium creatinivorum]|uniref:Uncharacterized protein n=1 Tax=Leucosporidium creatinivorum TaxID=106004 RepID=A0A1Y2FXA1_9BASI|nr:hypothetical protein BCR35DRAFT_329907 [Leucosporidium creatinivorum]
MLSSPLRRCILTQKVLPKDLMVQLKLARLPSQSTEPPRLILTPSSLLHPRFAPPMAGKGAHVMCSKDALDALARKGSYKRISSSASLPPITALKIQSQLARRVVQEAIMVGERVRSRPVLVDGGKRRECPVRRLGSLAELSKDGAEQESAGDMNLVAVVDLTEPEATIKDGPLSTLLPSDSSAPSIPVYHLAHFFKSALFPPNPSTTNFEEPSPRPSHLISSLRTPFDDLIALFAKRAARDSPTSTIPPPSDTEPLDSASLPIYAIYSPTSSLEPTAAEDVVPLLVALWRCRLWSGEGWTAEGDTE